MSANNGVYILRIKEKHRHESFKIKAISNADYLYTYDEDGVLELNSDSLIKEFENTPSELNKISALKKAFNLLNNGEYEHGIQYLHCDKTWEEITNEAMRKAG